MTKSTCRHCLGVFLLTSDFQGLCHGLRALIHSIDQHTYDTRSVLRQAFARGVALH